MAGRLNIFQRTMLQWDELHPYNAIHVVRVSAALDLPRLNDVLRQVLGRAGLTGLEIDRRHPSFRYQGGPAQVEIKLVTTANPRVALADEIEQQLNTRFALGPCFNPFRFFVVPETAAFSLGLVYFHPVADAESIVFLLQRIVNAYFGTATDANVAVPELYPAPRDGLLRRPILLLNKLAALPGMMLNMRRSCRPNYQNTQDTHNTFTLFSLPPGSLPKLLSAAKAWGVTINDLFLALLAQSLVPLAGAARNRRRHQLSLGCIVNLRRDLGLEGSRTFGLFLGSFIVTQAVPAGNSLREIAVVVHEHTERVKRRRLYLTTALELRFARGMLGFFSTPARRKLYQKHYPLWGGITNMNLNPLWPQPGNGRLQDYFRAVSTGPATPLVLSVTTVGEAVHVGMTCRRTVYSPADVERIQNAILETVSGPELTT